MSLFSRNARERAEHAVVIGSGIAGMLAARVLSGHAGRVTVIERDTVPDGPVFRSGVPQARHVHQLLARGRDVLEQLFPGLQDELLAAGAVPVRWGDDVFAVAWGREMPRTPIGLQTCSCSRELLEWHVRQRLRTQSNIRFLEGCEVTGLETDAQRARVVGVRLRPHGADRAGIPETLDATLVVDASGRSSRATRWLSELGYPEPEQTVIDSQLGYASAYFSLAREPDWRMLIIGVDPPTLTRSGVISAVEEGQWMVTLTGIGDDRPPTDEEAFFEFAASLPYPGLADMLRDGKRLSPIRGYRRTRNQRWHFERLSRWPEGFFVLGDAACTFNPVYGQGMTAAALGAETLDGCLAKIGVGQETAHRFQKALARAVNTAWLLATGADYQMPTVQAAPRTWVTRIQHAYMDRMTRSFAERPRAHSAFVRVTHLLDSPMALFHPAVVADVLTHSMSTRVK